MRKAERPIALVLGFTHPSLVVENFLEQMAGGLLALNYRPHIIYIDQDIGPQIEGLDISKVEFALSLGGLPLKLNINQKPIYEALGCPFVLYLIDNILYEFNNLKSVGAFFEAAETRPNLHLACCERSFASMLTDVWKERGCDKTVHFLPMAGFFQAGPLNTDKKEAIAVIGNLGALPAVGAVSANSLAELVVSNAPEGTSDKQISDIIARVTSETFKGNVAKEILAALGLPTAALLDPSVLRLATAVDRMLRLISRYSKVNSLRGLPVDFYGTGWKEAFPDHEGFNFCGQISHPEIARVLGHYKATLNFDPGFEDGVHDRVISALVQGTHVITNKNEYLKDIPGSEGWVHTYPYSATDIHEVAARALHATEQGGSKDLRKEIYLKNGWGERFFDLLNS